MPSQQYRRTDVRITACTAQHLGDRSEQQDRVEVLGAFSSCALGVLADGMGGPIGGSAAADNAILTAQNRFVDFAPGTDDPAAFLEKLVAETHAVVRLTGITTGQQPHSTFAAVLMQADRVDWCHVGDSRIYHIRDRRLLHCTTDHTIAQDLIRRGVLSPERAKLHPSAHQLVNTIGAGKPPVPTLGRLDAPRSGDTFLICSDGLWNYFHAGELVLVLEQSDIDGAARTLIARARERAQGHGDNCSLAVMRFNTPTRRPASKASAGNSPGMGQPAARLASSEGKVTGFWGPKRR